MFNRFRDSGEKISYFKFMRFLPFLPACIAFAGCIRMPQSTLDAAGPGAAPIAQVWWAMFWGGLLIFIGMLVLGLYAVYRQPRTETKTAGKFFLIGGGLVFPLSVLTVLLVYGIRSGDALIPFATDKEILRIEIRAHQWWWEIRYTNEQGEFLYSANELHFPAGRPIDLHITSSDVIHSFWLPRLGGKLDAIPGHTNVLRLQADEPGEFYGQCAEFCGAQHARMLLRAHAHDESGFRNYLNDLSNLSYKNAKAGQGQNIFDEQCVQCHSLSPRIHSNNPGPNLSDLKQRQRLGAGTLPNSRENLAIWIAEHQNLKPGNRMPRNNLTQNEIEAVVSYLWEQK